MSDVLPWLEYKWSLDFPVGMFRPLCERLRGTPGRLEEMLRSVPGPALVRQEQGRWSIQENAGHLWAIEELWQTRFEQLLRGEARLVAADMTNRKTHEAGFNRKPLDEILRGFRAAREKTMRRLDPLTLADAPRVAHHPRLDTPMRLVDLSHFAAEHDDHHLAVICALLRSSA